MNLSTLYIVISIVVLAVVAVLVFFVRGQKNVNRLTPLAGLSFACIIAGIVFGENLLLGYGLMGIGIILAVIDIFNRSRS